MAYPASRQMSFRIGITIGDVVERNGDLLGDGVNIAARLEGIAPVGGICISRTVYEQVANKLSVHFADIGEQQVKNIPTPVHAYKFEMRPDDLHGHASPTKKPAQQPPPRHGSCRSLSWRRSGDRHRRRRLSGGASGTTGRRRARRTLPPGVFGSRDGAERAGASERAAPARSHDKPKALVPELVPFVTDRTAQQHSPQRIYGGRQITRRWRSAPARSASPRARPTTRPQDRLALYLSEARLMPCRSSENASFMRSAPTVVYAGGRPPMPPPPLGPAPIRPPTRPLDPRQRHSAAEAGSGKAAVEKALSARTRGEGAGDRAGRRVLFRVQSGKRRRGGARRVLELCGNNAGVPCMAHCRKRRVSSCRSRRQ